jgi:hypothetical protein
MKSVRTFNLTNAETTFGLANAPLFLLRRLRADPEIRRMSEMSVADLFANLRKSLKQKPKTFRSMVRPYVYLAALSLKNDVRALHRATALKAPHHEWFEYLANVVKQTYVPTTTTVYHVSPSLNRTSPITSSNLSANSPIWEIKQ